MTNETIQVPITRIVEGKLFGPKRNDIALKECEDAGCAALYVPEIIGTRINAEDGSRPWQLWFRAPSIRATGRTKQGNAVVVYAHIPNHFSQSKDITKAIEQGLINGAGRLPGDEWKRLLDLEDNERVFVVDYAALESSKSGMIPVKSALKHPQTIPFLGGRGRAEAYLLRHEKNYGNQIDNRHCDDLADEPLARLLRVGHNYGLGLGAYGDLDDYGGQFLGVPKGAGEARAPRISKRKLAELARQYVANPMIPSFVKEFSDLQ